MTAVMTLYHYTARRSTSTQLMASIRAASRLSSDHQLSQQHTCPVFSPPHHPSSALPDVKIRGWAAIFLVISFSAHKFVLLADGAGRKMNQIVCNLVYLHELWTRLIELANKNSAQIPATANFDRGQPATVLLPPRPGIRYLGLYNVFAFYFNLIFITDNYLSICTLKTWRYPCLVFLSESTNLGPSVPSCAWNLCRHLNTESLVSAHSGD